MADDQTPSNASDPTAAPSGTPADPLSVTLAPPVVGGAVQPTDGIDETREGGAYIVNGNWVDAEGRQIKAPKGSK